MIVCKHCGKENQEKFRFCLGCGGEMATVSGPAAHSASFGAAVTDETNLQRQSQGRVAPALEQAAMASRPSSARACTVCGNVVAREFVFCGQCGARIEPTRSSTSRLAAVNLDQKPAIQAHLTLIRADGSEGGSHALQAGQNLLGRNLGALFANDGFLSPIHAELTLDGVGLRVRDAASINGIFVKIAGEEQIGDGAVFRIGQELFRFDALAPARVLPDGTELMGSPAPGYWGRLALLIGRALEGNVFPLAGESVTLGRERGDIVFPDDGYVSGAHASISCREGRFYLQDLNSSNGTFVRLRGERTVPTGSVLLLGQQLFRVTC